MKPSRSEAGCHCHRKQRTHPLSSHAPHLVCIEDAVGACALHEAPRLHTLARPQVVVAGSVSIPADTHIPAWVLVIIRSMHRVTN
jgi:hypothetical protein